MQIDWLTATAQLANFLVLIWLLKRFLFGPITAAMAEREARIETRLKDAARARAEAEGEAAELRDRQRALDEGRQAALDKVRQEADALRERLHDELREETALKRAAWVEHLKEDRAEIVLQLQKRVVGQVGEVLRRILADFAGAELADQMASEFARRIEDLKEEERRQLQRAADKLDGAALVESSANLSPAARGRITRALHDHIAEGIEVDYHAAEDVLFGIRLTLGHQVLEWSAARYLDRIETLVSESLDTTASEAVDAA